MKKKIVLLFLLCLVIGVVSLFASKVNAISNTIEIITSENNIPENDIPQFDTTGGRILLNYNFSKKFNQTNTLSPTFASMADGWHNDTDGKFAYFDYGIDKSIKADGITGDLRFNNNGNRGDIYAIINHSSSYDMSVYSLITYEIDVEIPEDCTDSNFLAFVPNTRNSSGEIILMRGLQYRAGEFINTDTGEKIPFNKNTFHLTCIMDGEKAHWFADDNYITSVNYQKYFAENNETVTNTTGFRIVGHYYDNENTEFCFDNFVMKVFSND